MLRQVTRVTTERCSCVGNQNDDSGCDEEPLYFRIQSDNVIGDSERNERVDYVDEELGKRLAQEVYVCSIHPVSVFSQENWKLQ